jgi:glucose/arabinose dehydrogenase
VFGRPVGSGPVYSRGHSDVTGLCSGGDAKLYATDNLPGGPDELDRIAEGGDYGWPAPTGAGVQPVSTFPAGQGVLGGCAVAGSTVFLGSLDGRRVDVVPIASNGAAGKITDVLADKYGRLRSVAVDADGGLWITTSNRDGVGTPAQDDDKVLRIVPPTSSGNSPL